MSVISETVTEPVTHPAAPPYRYITRMPSVRSGRAIVAGTRVGVHDIIGLLQTGESIDSIVTGCFPGVTRAQVYECLVYHEDNRGEIDLLVARQMADSPP